ncbi:transposase [Streptomyces sp. NPDC093093]|uniref:helix-turn-helix domain-containing protein n=1 Tax=Streptomyces sp. NPDC093093 TaxID=3366025 RepID=UPI003811CD17
MRRKSQVQVCSLFSCPQVRALLDVHLSDEERAELSRWAGGAVTLRFAERARIVLACEGGVPNARLAVEIGVTAATARKWRGKFAAEGIAASRRASTRSRTRPSWTGCGIESGTSECCPGYGRPCSSRC